MWRSCKLALVAVPIVAGSAAGQVRSLSACVSVSNGNDPPCVYTGSSAADVSDAGSYGSSFAAATARVTATDPFAHQIGPLHTSALATTSTGGAPTFVAHSNASYYDVLVWSIDDPNFVQSYLNGTIGLRTSLAFHYDGTLAVSGVGPWVGTASFGIAAGFGSNPTHAASATRNNNGLTGDPLADSFALTSLGTYAINVDATGYTTLRFAAPAFMSLSADAIADNPGCRLGAGTCGYPGSARGSANYDNTFAITGSTVVDQNGNPVPFRLFDSEGNELTSIFAPDAVPTVTPEPLTLAMVAPGLCGVLVARARRRRGLTRLR